jgi:uncharacterized protein (UPF0147 family)
MKKVLVSLLVLLVVAPVFAAMSVTRLEELAKDEVIPELRMAAGLALVSYYANNKTADELKELALSGATEAIKKAATLALSRVWVGAGMSYAELLDMVNDPRQPAALREAAVPALMEYLIGKKPATLETLYTLGNTFEVQYAAAKAYFHISRKQYKKAEDLEAICKDDSKPDAFRKAAAELLAGLYLFPPVTAKSQADLEDMALHADNPYIRYAASIALSSLLTRSDIPTKELWAKVASFFKDPSFTEEYKAAYIQALANRWAAEL